MKTLEDSQEILNRDLNKYANEIQRRLANEQQGGVNAWCSIFSRSLGMASGRHGLARAQAFVERTREADSRLGLLSSLGDKKWGQRSQQVIKNALADIFADNDSLKNQFQGRDEVRHCNWLDVIKKTADQFEHNDSNLEDFEQQLLGNLAEAEMDAQYKASHPARHWSTYRPFI